jgi:hypothetical protein
MQGHSLLAFLKSQLGGVGTKGSAACNFDHHNRKSDIDQVPRTAYRRNQGAIA